MNTSSALISRYWVVIPAAGIGQRFGAKCPKQYVNLAGKPLIHHTLSVFLQNAAVESVVVVLHPNDQYWTMPSPSADFKGKLITTHGGELRHDSVLQGLLALADRATADDWVLVHDAARPCLSQQALERLLIECSDDAVGGLLGLPATNTIKQVNQQGVVEKTLQRDSIWEAQTPQMFRYAVLLQALQDLNDEDRYRITDEASAIERQGLRPKMITGEARNIKITHACDLAVAEWVLRQEKVT